MAYFTQPPVAARILETIRKYRSGPDNALNRPCGIEELTEIITRQCPEFPITYYQYRAMENGQTKDVPVHVILSAAVFLGIPAHEIFPELDS